MTTRPLKKILFRDLDLAFTAHPETGALMVKKNEQAISQAIKNLVLLNKYERLYNTEIYSNVPAHLFNNFNKLTAKMLQNAVEDVINNYEPRAELRSVSISEDLDNNGITINVEYKPLNHGHVVNISVFLERVR